jgi:DNA polymerase-1
MGPGKLGKALGITFDEAKELLEKYNHSFPTVIKFLHELGERAKTHLEARTIIGSRRRWAKPSWDKAKERAIEDSKGKPVTDKDVRWKYTGMFGSIEREGKNAPIQGTNANLTKLAMALIWERLEPEFGALWLSVIHDELVVECPEDKAEACCAFMQEKMTEAGAMWIKSLPMTTEAEIEATWTKG